MFKNEYRVLRESAGKYVPQVRYWYFPFLWFDLGDSAFYNRASAKNYIINTTGETKIL